MQPELLAALEQDFQPNQSGVCSIKAVALPHASVKSYYDILKDTSANSYPLTGFWIGISIGFDWLPISRYKNVKTEFNESEEDTVNGKLFTYTIAITIPNDDYQTRGKILQAYDNREWIVEVDLLSGSKRLIGNNERGADFKANLGSGTTQKQGNFYQCGFLWKSNLRAHYIL